MGACQYDKKLDLYPTFGSNVSSPEELDDFYKAISNIDKELPLRFCLIEYDLFYKPVKWRRDNIKPKNPNELSFAEEHKVVYDRFQVIEKWDELLGEHLGRKYAQVPRHKV